MKRSESIQAKIDELTAKQAGILEAAEKNENGILTKDQQAEFDLLEEQKGSLEATYLAALKVEKSQARSNEIIRQPIVGQPITHHTPAADRFSDFSFANSAPATPRQALKAFKGQDAERNAYAAGMWALATFAGDHPLKAKAKEWCQSHGLQATLMTGDNAAGGYLVPNVMGDTIIELAETFGVFRRNAEIQPMTSGTWSGPRWSGAMVAYWVAEGSAPTSSDPRWNKVNLTAKDLAAMTKVTNQVNEDSIVVLGDKVAMCAALAFATAEDQAGFDGDGSSTYGGIAGLSTLLLQSVNAASLHAAASTHTTLATLTLADYNGLLGKFPEYPGAVPKWFCHKAVWAASMVPLQLAAGGATAQDIREGGKPTFLGYTVEFVQARPTTYAISTIPVLFGDLSLSSKLGDRRSQSIQSGWVNDDFTKQQFTLLATERVDIANHTIVDPINSTKAGPVMGLQLAAS